VARVTQIQNYLVNGGVLVDDASNAAGLSDFGTGVYVDDTTRVMGNAQSIKITAATGENVNVYRTVTEGSTDISMHSSINIAIYFESTSDMLDCEAGTKNVIIFIGSSSANNHFYS